MFFSYLLLAIIIAVCFSKLASYIGSRTRNKTIISLYFLLQGTISFCHYRIFLHGELGSVIIGTGSLIDIASLLLFIYFCIVPVVNLKKAMSENEGRVS